MKRRGFEGFLFGVGLLAACGSAVRKPVYDLGPSGSGAAGAGSNAGQGGGAGTGAAAMGPTGVAGSGAAGMGPPTGTGFAGMPPPGAGSGAAAMGPPGPAGTGPAGPSPDGGAGHAAEAGATACDPGQAFGMPVLVEGVNSDTAGDGGPTLTADELTMFFTSERSGGWELYSATRTSRSGRFGAPKILTALNSDWNDAWPSVSGDGLTLVFASNSNDERGQLFVTKRPSTAVDFPMPALVANVGTDAANDNTPSLLPDLGAIAFWSDRGGTSDLFRAARDDKGGFGEASPISELNTAWEEIYPTLAADDLTIYFSSLRPDPRAKGMRDIWMARRSSPSAAYDPPVNVEELNTSGEEYPSWISPDNCRLYFTRAGTTGVEIYVASRF